MKVGLWIGLSVLGVASTLAGGQGETSNPPVFVVRDQGGAPIASLPKGDSLAKVEGRVFLDSGNPAQGAEVWEVQTLNHNGYLIASTRTDDQGKFVMRKAPEIGTDQEQSGRFLVVRAKGHSVGLQRIIEDPGIAVVRLKPERKIKVRLKTPSGEPVARALVSPVYASLVIDGAVRFPKELRMKLGAHSDATGVASMTMLTSGSIQLRVDHDRWTTNTPTQSDSFSNEVVDIPLVQASRATGVLKNVDGRPVPRARVEAYALMAWGGYAFVDSVSTDGQGRYEFKHLFPTDYLFRVAYGSMESNIVADPLNASLKEARAYTLEPIQAYPGLIVQGKLLMIENKAEASGRSFYLRNFSGPPEFVAMSDLNGSFRFAAPKEGTISVAEAASDAFSRGAVDGFDVPFVKLAERKPNTPWLISDFMSPLRQTSVTGTVRNAQGQPVPYALVANLFGDSRILYEAMSDSHGRFTLPYPSYNYSPMTLRAYESRGGVADRVQVLGSHTDITLDPTLSKIYGFSVVDEEGHPLSARVEIWQRTDNAMHAWAPFCVRTYQTSSQGKFEVLHRWPKDRWIVKVIRDGYLASPLPLQADSGASQKIILRRANSFIAGQIVDEDGNPVKEANVRVGEMSAETSSEGHFRFDGLPAGTQQLFINAREMLNRSIDVASGDGSLRIVLKRNPNLRP